MVTELSHDQSRRVAEESRETTWDRPSFGRELFLGRMRLDLIHPHPRPRSEDQQRGEAFLAKLDSYLAASVDPEVIEKDARIPDAVIEGLAEIGALGMKIDRRYGGLGLSNLYYNRALMHAGSAHSAIGALLSAHQSIGVPQPLALFGTEEQRRKYLPRVARNEISAFLLTEPDVGSDPARLGATATPTPDGSGYRISGTKLWTTNGVIADLLVVMARVPQGDGHPGGITAFVVNAHAPGVIVRRRNLFMGIRGIENGVTEFDDVFVPREDVIGAEGRGLKIALQTLNTGRLSLPATCAAAAKGALAITREWARERVQWGQPIGRHDAIAQKIAFIAATTFALESIVELSSLLLDEGQTDIRIEAALAKLYCSEMAWRVCDDMVQIRGGRGFETAGSLRARGERAVPAEQLLRDLRISRIFEGSTEIMHLFIAREALDAHLSLVLPIMSPRTPPADRLRAGARAAGFYARWLPGLSVGPGQLPQSYASLGVLARHLRYVERTSRRLARTTFMAMARHQTALEKKQALLGRIVDIGAELFAMSAACSRAVMLDGEVTGRAATDLADLFCISARQRIGRLFHELRHNADRRNYRLAQEVLDDRFVWLERDVLDLYARGPLVATPSDGPARENHHRELVGLHSR